MKGTVEFPKLNSQVKIREESFGALAYNSDKSCVFELNGLAYSILSLCDGNNSFNKILKKINSKKAPISAHELKEFIKSMEGEHILNCDSIKSSVVTDPQIYSYIIARKYPQLSAPIMVNWEITNRCNLRCLHCYNGSGRINTKELPTSKVKEIIKDLQDSNVVWLAITGGEPFLRRDLFEIILYAKKIGLSVLLSTNGTLLTKNIARKLKKLNLEGIQISLDSAIPEEHDEQRNVIGSYDKTLNRIKLLMKEKVKNVTIATVATKINYRNIPAILELSIKLGVQGYRIMNLVPGKGTSENPRLFLSPKEKKWLFNEIKKREAKFNRQVNVFDQTPAGYLAQGKIPRVSAKEKLPLGCPAGKSICKISSDGFLYPCTYFTNPESNMGDLKRHSLKELWMKESGIIEKLRHLKTLSGKCKKCNYLKICGGGCRACAYNYYGKVNASDPTCWIA